MRWPPSGETRGGHPGAGHDDRPALEPANARRSLRSGRVRCAGRRGAYPPRRDRGGEWEVLAGAGGARIVAADRRAVPDATLTADGDTWERIASDLRGGMEAYRAGRLVVRHNLHLGVGFLAATSGATGPGRLRFQRIATVSGEVSVMAAGVGEPILLLHGLGATKGSFLPSVAALAGSFRTIAVDLPGFGDSYKPLTPRGRVAFYAAARQIYLEEPHGSKGFWTRLAGLEPPALFIWGRHDGLVPIAFATHVQSTLPSARHLELDCGHVPQIERPAETHVAIAAFPRRGASARGNVDDAIVRDAVTASKGAALRVAAVLEQGGLSFRPPRR
jgi:hypothetical protein